MSSLEITTNARVGKSRSNADLLPRCLDPRWVHPNERSLASAARAGVQQLPTPAIGEIYHHSGYIGYFGPP
jgi:hypothetical protein